MTISQPLGKVPGAADAVEPLRVDALRARSVARAGGAAEVFALGVPAAEASSAAARGNAAPDAYRRFEAMVLQTFIETMLPADATAMYGEGIAGEMWKSMLAEQLAGAMAARGGIGISDRLLGGRYPEGAATTDPAAGPKN